MICTYCEVEIEQASARSTVLCESCALAAYDEPAWLERRLIDFLAVWKQSWRFSGRATRSEQWTFWIVSTTLVAIAGTILWEISTADSNSIMGWISSITLLLLMMAAVLAFVTLTARRFHDVGRSGWWAVLLILILVPIVNAIALLTWIWLLGLWPSQISNKYGSKRSWRGRIRS